MPPSHPSLPSLARRSPARWALACLLAGVLVAALVRLLADEAGAPNAAVTPVQASTGACADVLFLGADGGGEVPGLGQSFGRTVGALHTSYVQRAAGSSWSVKSVRVPYTSQPIERIKRTATATGPASTDVTKTSATAWQYGVDVGLGRTLVHLRNAAVTCPHQQIVLAGYSQGAQIMHLTMLQTTAQIRSRITAVGLVGDPVRVAGTKAWLGGDPAAARTGSGVIRRLFGTGADVPATGWTQPVWTVCNAGDVACDFGPTRIGTAIAAHKAYGATEAGQRKMVAIAAALWGRTTLHPKPSVEPTVLNAEVSKPVSVQLGVDIAEASRGYVRWGATATMPPGLVLNTRGQVQGVPTVPGTWKIPYFVVSVQSAEFSRKVPGTLEIVVKPSAAGMISSGGGQACSVRADGTAWCWGRNNWGQVGDGTTTNRPLPTQVGAARDWTTIATGGSTTCGLRGASGELICWGLNYRGQVGDRTTTTRLSPLSITAGVSWSDVSVNYFHTCAIRREGTLWCWGDNAQGQLGDGTRTVALRNRQVGTASNWASVSTGGFHTCATKTDGTLWCWGDNRFGQLGDGTTTGRLTPVRVGTLSDWSQVSADWSHTCAVRALGEARCWGRNTRGQLGDGTRTSRSTPTVVAGGLTWATLAAGDSHSCGTTTDGGLRCWGGSPLGALGTGPAVLGSNTPAPVALAGPWRQADAGWVNGCGVRADGGAYCWGSNEYGQIGDGGYTDAPSPGEVK